MSSFSAQASSGDELLLARVFRRWWLLIAVVLVAQCVLWNAWMRARMLAELKSGAELRGMVLEIESRDGYFGTAHLHHVSLRTSAAAECDAERIEFGYYPWNRFVRVRGAKLRLKGPLDALWEQFHRVDWPPGASSEA